VRYARCAAEQLRWGGAGSDPPPVLAAIAVMDRLTLGAHRHGRQWTDTTIRWRRCRMYQWWP